MTGDNVAVSSRICQQVGIDLSAPGSMLTGGPVGGEQSMRSGEDRGAPVPLACPPPHHTHLPSLPRGPGPELSKMDGPELVEAVEAAALLARLTPHDKERVVAALQAQGHTGGGGGRQTVSGGRGEVRAWSRMCHWAAPLPSASASATSVCFSPRPTSPLPTLPPTQWACWLTGSTTLWRCCRRTSVSGP